MIETLDTKFDITVQRKLWRLPLSRQRTVKPGKEGVIVKKGNPEAEKPDIVNEVAVNPGGISVFTYEAHGWAPYVRNEQRTVLSGNEVNGNGRGTEFRSRMGTKVVFRAVPVK